MQLRRAIGLALLVSLLPSCNSGGGAGTIQRGTALQATVGRNRHVIGKTRPGFEWIQMSAFLWNRSAEPIELTRVTLMGTFADSVEVVRTEIARIPGTRLRSPPYDKMLGVVPGGLYRTYPPAWKERGERCHVQELHPVSGYVLGRDELARVLVWLRATSPGRFRVDGHLVAYEQGGQEFQQFLGIGIQGRVTVDAPKLAFDEDPLETACANVKGVTLLNSE
jgi:hypothetical protein